MILPEIILKQTRAGRGYPVVALCKDGNRKVCYVHRLVAGAFLNNINNYPTVNHIDGNKNNNYIENLEYVSYSYNNQHAYDLGLHASGEKHYKAKLSDAQVIKIREESKYTTHEKLSKKYNVSRTTITNIINNKVYKHIN